MTHEFEPSYPLTVVLLQQLIVCNNKKKEKVVAQWSQDTMRAMATQSLLVTVHFCSYNTLAWRFPGNQNM